MFLIMNLYMINQMNQKKCSLKEHENLINRKDEIYSNIMFYPGKLDNFMFGSIWGKIFCN